MKLFSHAFGEMDMIPKLYTCDGQDISPPLNWQDISDETKSFALSCLDPDAPGGTFIHWLIYNIPKHISNILPGGPLPDEAKEVENDFGRTSYGGPCPPSGRHRYIFTVYCLNKERLEGLTKSNFIEKVKEHTIESAKIIGLYERR